MIRFISDALTFSIGFLPSDRDGRDTKLSGRTGPWGRSDALTVRGGRVPTPLGRARCPPNAEAGDKKGDERKAFMSQCLKGGAAMPMTQQEKMKKCNAEASAKALKGDERKAFMSTCLKGDKM